MKRILALIVTMMMLVGIVVVSGCDAKEDEVLKVGVIYISSASDGGYSESHANGIAKAAEAHGDKIEIMSIEEVDYSDVQATNAAIENLVDAGCTLIFTTSFGFMEPTLEMATKYPDVMFAHCSGYTMNDTNMDAYFGQIETARYLAGVVAGMMTETNQLGYVAAYPIAEVVRGINAYTLGARSVNPDVVVKVVWTNTWFNPAVERAAAEALLAEGVDVMAQHQDSTAAIEATQEAGAYAIGYNMSFSGAPEAYLTAALWDWGVYYTYKIQQVLDDEWEIENYWGGISVGMVKLDELSPLVSDEARAAVEEAQPMVEAGENAFVFSGPIYDQNGDLRVSEGESLSYEDQMSMQWFVEGVIGDIPS